VHRQNRRFRDKRHHGSNNVTSSDRQIDVGGNSTSGCHAMTSLEDDDVETAMMEDHVVDADGEGEQALAAAADTQEHTQEPVWIPDRLPCSSTPDGGSWHHRQYVTPEVLHSDDDVIRRRKKETTTTDDDVTSGCHRAHALLAWKLAIVEWRAMSEVIDCLLLVVFCVATVLIHVIILVVLPMMKSTVTIDRSPTTACQQQFAA